MTQLILSISEISLSADIHIGIKHEDHSIGSTFKHANHIKFHGLDIPIYIDIHSLKNIASFKLHDIFVYLHR